MHSANLRILDPEEHRKGPQDHSILEILQVVTELQRRLQAMEGRIDGFSFSGGDQTIAMLIHRLAAQDKGMLQKFIRFIRKYDDEHSVYPPADKLHPALTDGIEDTIHDLRNGLTGMLAYVQMIERGKAAGHEQAISSGITRTAQYIEDLIDEALHTGKGSAPELLHIEEVIKQAIKIAGKHDVQIIEQIEDAEFIGNPVQLVRVFANILINAYQALPGENGVVFINSFVDRKKIFIMISDNGSGISPENISRLFTKHFTTKASGHGIGLALCKEIIENHGGNIEVRSKYGQGATFIIQLPLKA
ncbi:MAG: HAMP domain-containing sensor histidine kinase [Candidatus Margulisiibacteriota bacterium]|jgi:signal transduction histidine kinase